MSKPSHHGFRITAAESHGQATVEGIEMLVGTFVPNGGKFSGQPVFVRAPKAGWPKAMYMYYWDDKDGLDYQGWWIGERVGDDTAVAFAPSQGDPPQTGWRDPAGQHVIDGLRVAPLAAVGAATGTRATAAAAQRCPPPHMIKACAPFLAPQAHPRPAGPPPGAIWTQQPSAGKAGVIPVRAPGAAPKPGQLNSGIVPAGSFAGGGLAALAKSSSPRGLGSREPQAGGPTMMIDIRPLGPMGFRMNMEPPCIVTEVEKNSTAERNGLLNGSEMVSINGIKLRSMAEIAIAKTHLEKRPLRLEVRVPAALPKGPAQLPKESPLKWVAQASSAPAPTPDADEARRGRERSCDRDRERDRRARKRYRRLSDEGRRSPQRSRDAEGSAVPPSTNDEAQRVHGGCKQHPSRQVAELVATLPEDEATAWKNLLVAVTDERKAGGLRPIWRRVRAEVDTIAT